MQSASAVIARPIEVDRERTRPQEHWSERPLAAPWSGFVLATALAVPLWSLIGWTLWMLSA
jgi:hypothetical protein